MKVNGKCSAVNRSLLVLESRVGFPRSKVINTHTNTCFRKRQVLDGKVSGFGNRYDTLEQLLKEAKQLGHMNERKYEEVD